MSDHIVISGTGLLTAAGMSLEQNWTNIAQGESYIRQSLMWDTSSLKTQNYGEIYFDNDCLRARLKRKLRSDRTISFERGELLLFNALEEALGAADLDLSSVDPGRVGVLVGTSLSGFTNLEIDYRNHVLAGGAIDRRSLLAYPLNVVVDRVCYEYDLRGPRYLFSTACSASLHSVYWAEQLLDSGDVDVVLACGTDPLSLISMIGFSCLRSVARVACSPFSVTDPGVSIGEGAGVVIFEREEFRGRIGHKKVYLAGAGGNADAYHPTASDPMGTSISRCIDESVSGVSDSSTAACLLVSHGTGTPHNDSVETRAIKRAAKINAQAKVTGFKSVFGHTLGASGLVELALLDKCLKEREALPIVNFTEPRPGCNLDYVRNKPEPLQAEYGVKSAFAFGGNNVGVALTKSRKNCKRTPILYADEPVAITGLSMINGYAPLDARQILENVCAGHSSIRSVASLAGFRSAQESNRAAIVADEDLMALCKSRGLKNLRHLDRISRLAVLAALEATKDAKYSITQANTYKTALIAGTSTGPLESVRNFYRECLVKGSEYADAGLFPNTVVNAHAGHINTQLRLKGYTTVVTQGNASGITALDLGYRLLQSGVANMVLVGATAEYSRDYHRALIDLNIIGPEQAPYTADANGYVLGEGSTFFCMERLADAEHRGARIYAVVDSVVTGSVPVLPSTFRFNENPFDDLFERLGSKTPPDLLLGDGMGVRQCSQLELDAARRFLPQTPLATFTPYFGNVPGVNILNNIAIFCLAAGNALPLVKGNIPSTGESSPASIHSPNSALAMTVAEGGAAGLLSLNRYA